MNSRACGRVCLEAFSVAFLCISSGLDYVVGLGGGQKIHFGREMTSRPARPGGWQGLLLATVHILRNNHDVRFHTLDQARYGNRKKRALCT